MSNLLPLMPALDAALKATDEYRAELAKIKTARQPWNVTITKPDNKMDERRLSELYGRLSAAQWEVETVMRNTP